MNATYVARRKRANCRQAFVLKRVGIVFFIMFISAKAFAFDKLRCESDLKDWFVTASSNQTVMSSMKNEVTLSELDSQKLTIKSIPAGKMLEVFPWNSLYVRTQPGMKEKLTVTATELASSFKLVVVDKAAGGPRTLNCQFTF